METPGLFCRPVTSENILLYLKAVSRTERCIHKCCLNVADDLPCCLMLKSEWCVGSSNGVFLESIQKHKGSYAETIDINVLAFTVEETVVCVFISANIQELISKTCTGRERKCKRPGLDSQLVIVFTLGGNVGLEYSSGLPNALLFAGCLIIYSLNNGAEKKLNFFC